MLVNIQSSHGSYGYEFKPTKAKTGLNPSPSEFLNHFRPKGVGLLGYKNVQDSSHHQDSYIFKFGDLYKPSFATGILGGGVYPNYRQNSRNADPFVFQSWEVWTFFLRGPTVPCLKNYTTVDPKQLQKSHMKFGVFRQTY